MAEVKRVALLKRKSLERKKPLRFTNEEGYR